MAKHLQIGTTRIDVVRKRIKHAHLRVYPPDGAVRMSVPTRMPMKTIRAFVLSKLDWIQKQQRRIKAQERDTPREYTTGEPLLMWGEKHVLRVEEVARRPGVVLQHGEVILCVPPGTNVEVRCRVIQEWYRGLLEGAIPPLRAKWEPLVGAKAARISFRRMKTRWGSCTPKHRTIRINLDLARKPAACLEYILVHELVHLLESGHGPRFAAHMDCLMPDWRHRRNELKRRPLPHEDWGY